MTVLNNNDTGSDGHDYSKVIEIGDGLIMRWSTKADSDNVVELIGDSFRWFPFGDPKPEDAVPGPSEFLKAAARRLLSGKSSAMSEYDYALVEDTNNKAKGKNPIVACVSLHNVPAYYGSVNVMFGKPELIATEPSYRSKGLVRRLMFEMIHPASDAKGHILQLIPGIHYFYRQFGYEYGLAQLPSIKVDSNDITPLSPTAAQERYLLRLATQADIPFLIRLTQNPNQYLQPHDAAVGTRYTPDYWQYIVHDSFLDRQNRFDNDRQTFIITDGEGGKEVGFATLSHMLFGPRVEAFALDDGVHYFDVAYSALRQLFVFAKERKAQNLKALEEYKKTSSSTKKSEEPTSTTEAAQASEPAASKPFFLTLEQHPKHPLIQLLGTKAKSLSMGANLPGSRLYTRINSYPLFLKTVRPELERRLAQNPATAGTTCRLRLDFFRKVEGNTGKGLEIIIEKGQLVKIHDWAKPSLEDLFAEKQVWKVEEKKNGGAKAPTVYYATFAPLTFTQLVTGKQSVEELIWSYGENSASDDNARLVLNTLFPKVDHTMDIFFW
ncbi:hypothetical protein BGZ96_000897 [Linnemannia gamsii]|uniref:N-acetyltransferase domain-containing protein n=1 Tax=Linnemannia gamsii TaxID=64522 RepID=A0ABQ7JND1_9FUNG|nr:hypothetical protein BGZ96_000897 [Linnemannia gamsii]